MKHTVAFPKTPSLIELINGPEAPVLRRPTKVLTISVLLQELLQSYHVLIERLLS